MYEQQPDSQLRKDSVQAVTGIFQWPLLVKTWNCTRSKENSGTNSHGVPTRQENYEIFPRYDQLPQQILCAQCTPHSTPQCTHTSGHRLQPGKVHFENFNGLKVETFNMKVLPYFDVNAETTLQMDASKKGSWSMFNPEGKSHMLCFQGPHQD